MENYLISGIQQIGIGVVNLKEAWKHYIDVFNMDIRVLEDETVAELMLPYTGNQPQKRHAVIAVNMQGGGGFEVWQYTNRKPKHAEKDLQLGDLGINVAKIKTKNVAASFKEIQAKNSVKIISDVEKTIDGKETFFVADLYGNFFQFVQDDYVFRDEKRHSGGVVGAIIGVSDIEKALKVYRDILGYDKIVADETGNFADIQHLPSGEGQFRRVLLTHHAFRKGSLSRLMGPSYIELIQAFDRKPEKTFENRYWGDPGFIHLCFDITNMDALRTKCESLGFPFTADSASNFKDGESFDMGDAAGQFAYIEDPDGTLIELVETHKIPVVKKLNLAINLKKRDSAKPLPDWMLKALRFARVKAEKL